MRYLLSGNDEPYHVHARAVKSTAHALFLMTTNFLRRPSLRRARETYEHLGTEYTSTSLEQREIEKLLNAGFVAESEIEGNRIRRDEKIRELVKEKLCGEYEGVGNLICLSENEIDRMVQENMDSSKSRVKRILDLDELIETYGLGMGHYYAEMGLQNLAYGGRTRAIAIEEGEEVHYHEKANVHFNYGVFKLGAGDNKGGEIQFKVARLINPFDEGLDRDIRIVNSRYG